MIIKKPITFDAGQEIPAAQANENLDVLYEEINGNLDDSNVKEGAGLTKILDGSVPGSKLLSRTVADGGVDYTSSRVLRMGPTHPGNNGIREVSGTATWTIPNGQDHTTRFIVFATESAQGNPRFSSPPVITLDIEHLQAGVGFDKDITVRIEARYATGFLASIKGDSAFAVGADGTGLLHWFATGTV